VSDFAKLSEVDSIFLYVSHNKDDVTKGGDKNNKHLSHLRA